MKKIYFIGFLILISMICSGKEQEALKNVQIKSWLLLGPAVIDSDGNKSMSAKEILNYKYLDTKRLVPKKGDKVTWSQTLNLKWKNLNDGVFRLKKNSVLYFATYLKTNRWLKTKLVINDIKNLYKIYMNGNHIKSIKNKHNLSTDLKLTNEKHLIVIKVVIKNEEQFIFKPSLELKTPFDKAKVTSSLKKDHRVNINNILNTKNINSVSLSFNGEFVKVTLSKVDNYTEKTNRWIEVLKVSDGRVIFSSKNFGQLGGFKWLRSSSKFSYTKNLKGLTSLYIYDMKNKSHRLVLANVKNFSTYWWSPDNRYFIYSTSKIIGKNNDYKHIKELPLRAKNSGYKTALNIVYINRSKKGLNSITKNITNYKDNFSSISISPDGKKAILNKSINDYKHRPYTKYTPSILDLVSGKIEKLLSSYWINGMIWSPDSKQLLMTGGPSSFNNIGNALSKDIIPNDYDGQIFIFDLKTKKAIQLSKDFDPSISSVYWKKKNTIYLRATDKSYSRIYQYNIRKKEFKKTRTKVDVVGAMAIAKNTAVYSGSSTIKSAKLYRLNLSSNKVSLLKDYNKSMFGDVVSGKCKDWDFITESKRTIKGRLYYPPEFNKNKKYPCIVYYYGGTSPVTREFGGRYPKNWYAAHDYIVYVLQPTGATGFGQEASSVHVNDWGKVTSKEIIEGIKKLTNEHPYIDPKRIGSMGASYGGFLTQYLATQTDTIAAFISHAGISDLSSYWGIGEWGYLYSGVASAESFPWNRKDLYIGHSPLFMVDRIKNPILLLHGDNDNNVPPGESYQMYAALKLAGKEAELITFKGQRHFILEYRKRVRWMRTIIAWFDKWLKAEPEHWDDMYNNPN